MKIATWNVNSIQKRLPLIIRFLKEENVDILCLQELKTDAADFPAFELTLEGYHSASVCEKGKNGVAIISKHKIEVVSEKLAPKQELTEKEARFILANVWVNDEKISVASVYVPVGGFKDLNELTAEDKEKWNHKLTFLRALYLHLKQTPPDIVLGDFNMVSSLQDISDKTKTNFICCSEKERLIFSEFLKLGYENVYQTLNPNTIAYSWWSYQFGYYTSDLGYRLDHILCKQNRFEYQDICIKKDPWRTHKDASDHAPVILTCTAKRERNDA